MAGSSLSWNIARAGSLTFSSQPTRYNPDTKKFAVNIEIQSDERLSIQNIVASDDQNNDTDIQVFHLSVTKVDAFPFLRLPGEIRNIIYGLVLEQFGFGNSVTLSMNWSRSIWAIGRIRGLSGLILLNRQVAREAVSLLYRTKRFDLPSMLGLKRFLLMIGPRNRSLLRNLSIARNKSFAVKDEKDALSLLAGTPKLERLVLKDRRCQMPLATRQIRALLPFLSSVERDQGDIGAAVKIIHFANGGRLDEAVLRGALNKHKKALAAAKKRALKLASKAKPLVKTAKGKPSKTGSKRKAI